MNNTQRGALWSRVVKSKTGGAPYGLINSLLISPVKGGIKEDLLGKNPGKVETDEPAQEEAQAETDIDLSIDNMQP